MRDVISNETIKEINEVIDEILTNINDNVRNIVGAGNYSLPTIFSYTNYSGQTINVHGSTFRHEIIIDNADGNNLIGDICTVIGDRNGIKLAKAGVEDRHDAFANYWDSTFDIAYNSDTAINGYVFDMQSGFVGEGTGQSKVMSFKLDNLEVGKAYTLTFRGKFVHAQFVSGQESLVRICSTTAETPYLAQVTLEKDTDAHIYRIDFTNNTQDTTLYLNFWFYGVADNTEIYHSEFIADDLIIAGMNIGIISRYIDYNGKWYPIEAGGGTTVVANPTGAATEELSTIQIGQNIYSVPEGGGTTDYPNLTNKPSINSVTLVGNKTSSDLGVVITLTQAEYNALTAAEKADPNKVYYITDSTGEIEKLHFDWSYTTLPATGDENTIYCIPTGSVSNPYNFYAWNSITQQFIQLQFTFDMSNYMLKNDYTGSIKAVEDDGSPSYLNYGDLFLKADTIYIRQSSTIYDPDDFRLFEILENRGALQRLVQSVYSMIAIYDGGVHKAADGNLHSGYHGIRVIDKNSTNSIYVIAMNQSTHKLMFSTLFGTTFYQLATTTE